MSEIIKTRPWAAPIGVAQGWKTAGIIARHRPYFYYRDRALFPCDLFGFRIPDGHDSVQAKYAAADKRPRIFCFGGSTTFGSYLPYAQSWPAALERQSGAEVFNFGLQELDLHANLYTFVDVLREGMRPDIAVFYDGINEKIGFRQAERGRDSFITEHVQYEGFTDLLRLTDIRGRLRDKLARLFGRKQQTPPAKPDQGAVMRFAQAQADHYLTTRTAIAAIAEGLGIRCLFVLQPTIWDVWDGEDPLRGLYLRNVYDHIAAGAPSVLDISKRCRLNPDMFYDACHLTAQGNEEVARVIMTEGELHCAP